ncbi:MAG TPA: DUF4389 domain-containing protein [Rhizomicrobium sp.]|nr:DUF4389 domain-containing protein [Rhizomicrobium sp.]
MTDVPPNGAQVLPAQTHTPFPLARLLFALGFAVLAWVALWVLLVLGAVQFVFFVINGKTNPELKRFSLNLVQYLVQCLAFVTFVRDEHPFPFSPFPTH